MSKSGSGSEEGYLFTIVDGAVVAMFEVEEDGPDPEPIRPNQSFAIAPDGTVTERETAATFVEIRTYSPDGEGAWTLASERYEDLLGNPLPDDPEDHGDDDDGVDDDLDDDGDVADDVTGDAGDDSIAGGDGDDEVHGGGGHDDLRGDAGDDALDGGEGDDDLDGGEGADLLEGGGGGDTLRGARDDDALRGSSGDDRLDGGIGDDSLLGGIDDDTLRGGDGEDRLEGEDGADILVGGHGADDIAGGDGADRLEGGTGDDTFRGAADADRDTVLGGTGEDLISFATLGTGVTVELDRGRVRGAVTGEDRLLDIEHVEGGEGADRITGNDLANALHALGGDDRLFGGGGADTIAGGGGIDRLTGGAGDDLFVFGEGEAARRGSSRDVIDDFATGADRIDLSAIDADAGAAGDQAFHLVGRFSGHAGELVVKSNGTILGDTNGDRIADLELVAGDARGSDIVL